MLTALAIEKLKPKEKPYRVSDGNQLSVLVEPAGAKLWRLRYTFDGKEKMLSLGSYPEVSLADARGKRDEALELIEQTIQLRARSGDAFENSLTAICAAVCDTFRPATAAEFVEKLNEDIRSEIEFGKSKGGEVAREVWDMEAACAAQVPEACG